MYVSFHSKLCTSNQANKYGRFVINVRRTFVNLGHNVVSILRSSSCVVFSLVFYLKYYLFHFCVYDAVSLKQVTTGTQMNDGSTADYG